MIPFDLEYHLPASIDEAVELYTALEEEKNSPFIMPAAQKLLPSAVIRRSGPGP